MFDKLRPDRLTRFVIAVAIALGLLVIYNRKTIDADNAALGVDNHAAFEVWHGHRITAPRPPQIASLIEETRLGLRPDHPPFVLWLGNSQLHTINQYRLGEHLAPYWLGEAARCADCIEPLGVSLPNANFQEYLVLAHYAMSRLPISVIVVKLVFDKLREDGLRDELEPLLTDDVRSALSVSDIGAEMLDIFDKAHVKAATGDAQKGGDKQQGLDGFLQKPIEERLDTWLSVVPLWADRANLRGHVMLDLYDLRNFVFGIKPNSTRKMIPGRYDRNMKAFDQLVKLADSARVPLIVYVAPIRNDVPIPYESAAYERWKSDVARMAAAKGFVFMNLERLVPNDQWGSYRADEIDFMHFKGQGHKLLADALWPEIQRRLPAAGSGDKVTTSSGRAQP